MTSTTQATSVDVLPITKYLEESLRTFECIKARFEFNWWDKWIKIYSWKVESILEILPQVRTLEQEQQAKVKQEEIERIVGIFEEIKEEYTKRTECKYEWEVLQEAIERITNQP